jgi:starch synthase
MRIGLAAAEVTPFAKTGGLGDVAAALARYLAKHGHDVRLFLPLYGKLDTAGRTFSPVGFIQDVPVRMGDRTYSFSVFSATLPKSDLPVYFVACPALYGRPAIYAADGDEHVRFAFLARAAIECCQRMGFAPHVFHVHDWHTALVPLYLRTLYAWDRLFARTKTVLTLHNLAYQGAFPPSAVRDVGLAGFESKLHQDELRGGRFSFLTSGVLYADAVTAVSETYAKEILTPEQGMGMDPLLRSRGASVFGIVNGVDYDDWSPENDALIPARYSASDLGGKAVCRERLLAKFGLDDDPSAPVVGVVSRLTSQKGFELATDVLPSRLARGNVRVVALGSGAQSLVEFFGGLARRFPRAAAFKEGYDNVLAHEIEAGADVFLMPSRFEPCGLNQMYSLRYGTPPIVRRTGGLADTVEPWNPAARRGTGFVFDEFSPSALAGALDFALRCFHDRPGWRRLQANGMAQDFSWDRQIQKYVALYSRLAAS